MMSVKLSSKFELVIPVVVREALHLTPGMEIDVIVKGRIAYLVPVSSLSTVRERVSRYLSGSDLKSSREKKDRKV